jgi:adenosyl cobinamide kinase/adenosyl cobinamide phosphate guanylyltransferase
MVIYRWLKDLTQQQNNTEEFIMIEKLTVRKRLASYETKLKEEAKKVDAERQKLIDACTTSEARTILFQSKEYAELATKFAMLNIIRKDIMDMRCEEMFDD